MLARVTDALMHNHSLANQWVKSFRGDAAPSRFDVAVALMLCRGPRSATAQQKTVDALKASVTACLQHERALKSSPWASELQHTPHRSTRCAAVLLHGLAQSQNGGLASQLVAFAQHLLAAHTVKGVMLSQVPYAEEEDYTGLVWWTCDAPHNSCLSLAGAAILEQVRPDPKLLVAVSRSTCHRPLIPLSSRRVHYWSLLLSHACNCGPCFDTFASAGRALPSRAHLCHSGACVRAAGGMYSGGGVPAVPRGAAQHLLPARRRPGGAP